MQVLYVVPYVPSLIRVRPLNLLRSLARRGNRVVLATLWSSEREREELRELAGEGIDVLAEPLTQWRSLANVLRSLPTPVPLQAAYCWQPALARRLQAALEQTAFDVIHVEHLRGAHYGLFLSGGRTGFQTRTMRRSPASGGAPVVWDSVDSISHLFSQAARHSHTLKQRVITQFELARTRRYEGWLVRHFDHTLVTSPVDRLALLELATGAGSFRVSNDRARVPSPARISVLPNGVDLEYFQPCSSPREPASVVFTGKMSYHANEAAALHLVQQIMPLVWSKRPDVVLYLVGKEPTEAVRNLADGGIDGDRPRARRRGRVVVTGTVPDIRPYLRRASVAVAPLPYGAGIQNKVLEAMACGTPVVASAQAVSALETVHGEHLLVGDCDQALARHILSLLDNAGQREALGEGGRAYVARRHDWARIACALEAIYADAISSMSRDGSVNEGARIGGVQ